MRESGHKVMEQEIEPEVRPMQPGGRDECSCHLACFGVLRRTARQSLTTPRWGSHSTTKDLQENAKRSCVLTF